MSKIILRDQQIFLDGYQIDSLSNSCSIEAKKDVIDVTTFGNTSRVRISGLFDFTFSAGGFMDPASSADAFMFNEITDSDMVVSVSQQSPAVGGYAYLMNAIVSDLKLLGKVGEAAPFSIGAAGDSMMTEGVILAIPTSAITATGSAAVQQNTNAAIGKKLKLALHVLGVSGTNPAITFTLKSSSAVGMTSPTTLWTSGSINALNGIYGDLPLSLADTYFQLSWTVTGTTPSFSIMASFAIV